jgi:hypothetical protein
MDPLTVRTSLQEPAFDYSLLAQDVAAEARDAAKRIR